MDIGARAFWELIGVAVLCGGIVGLERQLRGKVAGIRTSIMICLGTSLFISLGVERSGGSLDPTRVLGQVVTGVGFLGAGVILSRRGHVTGVTSASVVWVLAALGAMIGFGKHEEAITISLLVVGLLAGIGVIEGKVPSLRRGVHANDDEGRGKGR